MIILFCSPKANAADNMLKKQLSFQIKALIKKK